MLKTRRETLWLGLGAALAAAASASAQTRRIPQRPSARVIVDNDFAGDPDGLVALAHQLLALKTRTVLVTTSALDRKFATPGQDAARTAAAGRRIAGELIRRAGVAAPPVVAGSDTLDSLADSAAARAIVAEAMREDPLPLILTCGGPLTNVAAALRLEPAIARRMTVAWIGGGGYPAGGWEYNLAADAEAARAVIERSAVPLWQVPQPAYRQMQMSVAELGANMRPISPLGAWLYEQFTNPPPFIDVGGTWPLGDSPLVLLTALTAESSRYRDQPARRIGPDLGYGQEIAGRTVRVFETLDARLVFQDFLALLRLHAAAP